MAQQIVVNIEVASIPSKKQDKQILKLELDPDTTILDIIDYLIEQNRILVNQDQIEAYDDNGALISKNVYIQNIHTKNKPVNIKLKSNNSIEQSNIDIPIPSPSLSNYSQPTPIVPTRQTPLPSYSQQPSYKQVQKPIPPSNPVSQHKQQINTNKMNSQQRYSVDNISIPPRQSNIPSQKNTMVNTNNTKPVRKGQQSPLRDNDDIEFKVEFKEGGYLRQFHYSSKRNDKSQELTVKKNDSNIVQIVINDKNRRIKFQVDKI